MVGRLDALGDDLAVELLGVRAHGVGHRDGRGVVEGAQQPEVELDDLRAKQRHEGEGGGHGADVVQRDGAAGGPQALGGLDDRRRVPGERPLGELDDQAEPVRAGGDGVEHLVQRDGEGARLEVDEQQRVRPGQRGRRVPQVGAQGEDVELGGPAGGARGRDQGEGRLELRPDGSAQQGLVRDGVAGAQVHHRLQDAAQGPGAQHGGDLRRVGRVRRTGLRREDAGRPGAGGRAGSGRVHPFGAGGR